MTRTHLFFILVLALSEKKIKKWKKNPWICYFNREPVGLIGRWRPPGRPLIQAGWPARCMPPRWWCRRSPPGTSSSRGCLQARRRPHPTDLHPWGRCTPSSLPRFCRPAVPLGSAFPMGLKRSTYIRRCLLSTWNSFYFGKIQDVVFTLLQKYKSCHHINENKTKAVSFLTYGCIIIPFI